MPSETSLWKPNVPPWSRFDALAIGVWSVAIAWVFRDAVIFRGALFYFDITELNYPYRAYLFRELAAGRLSFWQPNLYCGLPLFSESQAGYFHPLKYLLYPWMETWRAFNLDTVVSVWLAGVGTYGWLRRHVGAIGALTGASIVGLGGYTWAHLIHTSMVNALASVPFAVWALESSWDRGRFRAAALGGLALAFQVFAGHLQDTILTCSALGTYTLIRACGERTGAARTQVLWTAFVMVAIAGLISAVQWMPSKELLDRSPRAGGLTHNDLTYGSWHPQLLPALLVHETYGTRSRNTDWMDGFFPYHEMDVYLGVVGLFLAAIGAKAWRDRWVGTWLILGVIGVLLMLGRFTFLMDYLHRVPIVGSSRIPVRYHLWVTLAAAALVAVGVDRLARSDPKIDRVSIRPGVFLMALLLLGSALILYFTYRPIVTENWRWTQREHHDKFSWISIENTVAVARNTLLILATIVCAGKAARSANHRHRAYWSMLLPLFSIADMAAAHINDIPTVPPAYWTDPPESVKRLRSDPQLVRIYGEGTYSSGEPGHASKEIDFMVVRETVAWSLPAAWDVPSTGGETPILSRRRFRFGEIKSPTRYDLEGLSHILSVKPDTERLGPAEKVGAAYLHKNPRALPRLRIVGNPAYASDEKDAAKRLKELGEAAKRRIVVESAVELMRPEEAASGTAKILREVPDRVEIEAEITSKSGFLLLADTFDPGWSVTVDGRSAAILPANIAFRAVYLEQGKHSLIFTYRPARFVTGVIFSTIGLLGMVVLIFLPRKSIGLRPAHDRAWGRVNLPGLLLAIFVVVLVASTVKIDARGSLDIQNRWKKSFHTFTWGAKIEAIQPPPPPME